MSNLKPLAQEAAWRALVAMSAALPQGLILVGPSGVGKRRAVKALFQLLNCKSAGAAAGDAGPSLFGAPEPSPESSSRDEPCGECVSCRKIAQGHHTDLVELAPKGDTIPVEELRSMKVGLHYPPLESSVRFVIIDEAHRLGAASANTLLKTLEEPPAHTRFFLVTHERGLLLPTVTSRCQFLRFAPLDDDTVTRLLTEQGYAVSPSQLPLILALLGGGMDRAPLLTDEKTLDFLEAAERALGASGPLAAGAAAEPWTRSVQLAEQLGTQSAASGDGPSQATSDWRTELLLDLLVIRSRRASLAGRTPEESLRFARRALEATRLRRRLERHANKKLIALAAADLAVGGLS
jgi:DNA polymerase III delta' subunit